VVAADKLGAMHLRQLEYLAALAREQHFARAAAACHVSQSALSEGIRRLEADLGVQIVRRSRSFEGFTPEGERVVFWARQMLGGADELRSELSNMRDGLAGRLRVAAIPTALAASSLITSPFLERHPHVRLTVASLSSRDIVARLGEFQVDVGVSYVDGEPLTGAVRTVPLYAERYLLLTADDGELAEHDEVAWGELAATPLCLLTPDMQNRRIIDRFLADAGVDAQPAIETDAVSVLYAHVATRRWSTIVAHAWLHLFRVPDGVRAIPMAPPANAPHVGLILPDTDPQPILVQAFLEVAAQVDLEQRLDELLAAQLADDAARVRRPPM
jgi:DNA-binding transcriptional LysR family regulator